MFLKSRLISCLSLTLSTAQLLAAAGEPKLLWQIGLPNRDYAEFALARNYGGFQDRFGRQPVIFDVGRSDPRHDWPFIQPGPVDAWAGNREHPFTIRFDLAGPPKGVFTVRIKLVDTQASVPPRLAVRIGERQGLFPLGSGSGDASLVNPSAGKPQEVTLSLPADLLRQGSNTLELTAAQGSWLLYDSVEFLNDPNVDTTNPEIRNITVEPTPLLVREDGKLRRVLNVKADLSAPAANVALAVESGGESRETTLGGLKGAEGYRAQVSALQSSDGGTETVKVTVRAGNRTRSETVTLKPAREWKIFVAASAHTDIGYTDLQPKCAERHNENTDLALGLLERFPDFKWNLEVAWQAENYLHARDGKDIERFVRFAKEGRLGVQALYCNILTGLCSHESACRLTQFAHGLSTRYGIPYKSAMISDVPTQEASLPMLLAGAGIRYFSSGINNDRAYPFTHMQNQSPCWWEGPDGSRVLMMYAPSYAQASGWGLDTSLEAAANRIVANLQQYEARANYPYDAIFLHGAFGDNSLLSARLPELVRAWNERYASPKLLLSHNAEFFEYIEKNYGDKLPVFRGSAGSYWEDGAGSSARETTMCRRAEETLSTAESLLALTAQAKPAENYPVSELESAWRNCALYDEHTWGANCSISQPDSEFSKAQWKIKAQFAVDGERQAQALLTQSGDALAGLVKTDQRSLIIFNSASWPRTDVVRVRLPDNTSVVGAPVISCENSRDSLVLVKDVPACGYKVLKLGAAKTPRSAQPIQSKTIESAYYRVTFDPLTGAVTGVFDKRLKRELVDRAADYALNQYLYVAGGEDSRIVMNPNGPVPKLTISKAAKGTLRAYRLGNLGERMVIESSAPMAPKLVTEVTVWNDMPRIDFVNRLTKTQTYAKEAVYFAFPLAADRPTVRYQCPAGIVNVNADMLPGACLDWFSVQQAVEIDAHDAAIAWATPDAPLVCLQDINRGKWQRDLPMTTGHLFSYAMNNYWHTNYKPGQGGDHEFRFSLTSRRKADNAASARFGRDSSSPLQVIPAEANPTGILPARPTSLVEIAEPSVILISAKKADTGKGLILRLWEVNGRATQAHIRLNHLPVRAASACNLVEEPVATLQVHRGMIAVPIRGSGLATVRVDQ